MRACFLIEPEDSGPATAPADLVAVDAVEVSRARRQEVAQARTFEALKSIAKARGYKSGWAYHVWRERQQGTLGGPEWGERRYG